MPGLVARRFGEVETGSTRSLSRIDTPIASVRESKCATLGVGILILMVAEDELGRCSKVGDAAPVRP